MMTTTMMDQHRHVVVTTNDIVATDDNNMMITLVDDDCVVPRPPAAVLEGEIVVGKHSFIDILKLNPNLEFEDKKKKPIAIRPSNAYNYNTSNTNSVTNIIIRACTGGGGIANLPPSDAKDRVALRATEKRFWAAKNAKDRVQQALDLKQADCDEAEHGHHAAVSDEQALKGLLKSKNVEICEAQSELKRFKSSGGTVEKVLQNTKGLVLLADGLMSIQDALRSSGIGIHDLDWAELFDELLKPMKMEVVSLKENIRKAQVTAKASKKKYDNKTEELELLKVQLKEAEDVFQEANRELMRLQNKDITKEDVDIIADKEDETQAKDAPDLPCVGQIHLDRKLKETCKEDAGTYYEKTFESKNICINGTTTYSDKTSEPEVGCSSDGGLNIKEVDDAAEGDLVEEGKNEEEEVKKVELSKNERAEQDTNKDEIHNGTAAASTEPDNKKKPNKRERRALAKAALLAVKEKKIKEDVSDIKHDEYGSNLEQGRVSEQILKLNTKEIDDDENTWNEEELDKVELSETEIGEEEKETISDDSRNYDLSGSENEEEETANDENHKYPSRKKYRNKKKQKKVARKARRARAAELKALEGNGDRMTCMKMPFAIGCLMMLLVMVMLWCLL